MGDTRMMEGILAAKGHALVPTAQEADVLVLNTCTVVQSTDQKMTHRLRQWRQEGKQIVAAGCMAAAQPERIQEAAPQARLLTPRNLHEIHELITQGEAPGNYRAKTGLPRTLGATDVVLPLAEGCLFSCSYCLTKKARGDQTSYPLKALVADVREALNQGAIEVKLTSQDTSGYGFDTGTDLAELIQAITRIGGDFRLRAGMMHPRTTHRILDPLLDAMDHPNVYKFLHLPIQTGSPRLLKAMRRGHTMQEFWQTVHAFRERFPASVVSTDIIVAFPGETREDHQATLDLLQELKAEHVNITRFSPRPGTDAPHLGGRIPTDVAKERSREATACVMRLWREMNPRRIGETLPLFLVAPGKKPGSVIGRGPAYEPVALRENGMPLPLGSRIDAKITEAHETYFIAEPTGPAVPIAKARKRPDGLPHLPVVP